MRRGRPILPYDKFFGNNASGDGKSGKGLSALIASHAPEAAGSRQLPSRPDTLPGMTIRGTTASRRRTVKAARASRSRPTAAVRLAGLKVRPDQSARWTFLTNHSHVLIVLADNPSMVLREVAVRVGITERAVQRIIADLEEGGFIERRKVGRQNHYRIRVERPLRHPIEAHRSIGELLELIAKSSEG